MSEAVIWLPLICYAIVRLHERPTAKIIALCAFAFAMPVLAGHPETAAHITVTALALASFLALTKPSRPFVSGFLAAGFLAIALSAVQTLPTVEWLAYTHQSVSAHSWPAQPHWALLGWISRELLHPVSSFGLNTPEQTSYLGMIVFAAVPLALMIRGRNIVLFLFGWMIITLSVAYGFGPFFWLSHKIPIIQGIKNSRLIFAAGFCLSVLAGLGIAEIERWDQAEARKHRARAAVLLLAGCSIALTLIYVVRLVITEMSEASRYPRVSALLLLIGASVLLLRLFGKINSSWFRAAVITIVSLDMVTYAYGFMPFSAARDIFPPVAVFERLPRQTVEPYRIAQMDQAYTVNSPSMYGLADAGGYEVGLRRIHEFVGDLSTGDIDRIQFRTDVVLSAADRRLDMLNAKYFFVSQWGAEYLKFRSRPDRFQLMYSTENIDVYENKRALAAAHLVPASRTEVSDDRGSILNRLRDPTFDPETNVILNERIIGSPANQANEARPSGTVEWKSRRRNSFDLEVNANVDSVLVVSQTFYPGWVAFIDGRPTRVVPANHALTGIGVPAGAHHIRFEFQSPSFRAGLIISALAALLTLGLAVKPRASSKA